MWVTSQYLIRSHCVPSQGANGFFRIFWADFRQELDLLFFLAELCTVGQLTGGYRDSRAQQMALSSVDASETHRKQRNVKLEKKLKRKKKHGKKKQKRPTTAGQKPPNLFNCDVRRVLLDQLSIIARTCVNTTHSTTIPIIREGKMADSYRRLNTAVFAFYERIQLVGCWFSSEWFLLSNHFDCIELLVK